MKLTDEQIKNIAESLRKSYLSDMKEALNGENQYSGPDDASYSEDFGIWLDSPHPEVPEFDKWYNSGDDLGDDYNSIHKAALPSYDEFVSYISSKEDDTPDDPDESSDKPHDDELAGETTPEEDFMQRAAEGKIPATSGVLAGDLTPEEIEMIQMMRAGKQPPKSKELAGETTPEEEEMLKLAGNQTVSDERMKNITNRLAINLSKHRW